MISNLYIGNHLGGRLKIPVLTTELESLMGVAQVFKAPQATTVKQGKEPLVPTVVMQNTLHRGTMALW